jgi:hypothetical protein
MILSLESLITEGAEKRGRPRKGPSCGAQVPLAEGEIAAKAAMMRARPWIAFRADPVAAPAS